MLRFGLWRSGVQSRHTSNRQHSARFQRTQRILLAEYKIAYFIDFADYEPFFSFRTHQVTAMTQRVNQSSLEAYCNIR